MSSSKPSALTTFLFFCTTTAWATGIATNNTDCSCGYRDPSTNNLYTDSLIVYFNETDSLGPTGLEVEKYEHPYEKGWNDQFRQGADLAHLTFWNGSDLYPSRQSLALNLSMADPDHLVMGGSVETVRRDIQYGTFRALLKSPLPWTGGSALTMEMLFNETQTFSVNLYSTRNASDSRITMLMDHEFPDAVYAVNYTTLIENGFNPWDYVEYRLDWNKDYLSYTIGNKTWRNVTEREIRGLPTVPGPIHIKHWSTGNFFAMQGPPWQETSAFIGWIRLFFNASSSTLKPDCRIFQACSVDDMSLRGFTSYPVHSTEKWEERQTATHFRISAVIVISIGGVLSTFLLLNAFVKRTSLRNLTHKQLYPSAAVMRLRRRVTTVVLPTMDCVPASGAVVRTACPTVDDERFATPWDFSNKGSPNTPGDRLYAAEEGLATAPSNPDNAKIIQPQVPRIIESRNPAPLPRTSPSLPTDKKRVDCLAGLVAASCLIVTGIHFCLTFVNASINPGAYSHYTSDVWARKTITPFLLNLIWIGPFLMTSSRFLVSNYLQHGNMAVLAEKTVCRTPRLIIPVMIIALIQYLLMDTGATKWLEYLPSISWSTWPFTVVYENFGAFVTEILELVYLTPNAAPQISFNYCTGVLWTIPIQLQGSWTVLLGVIIICEIKTPWKRFTYYVFCILNNWYGLSWGSYYWLGLLIADLDYTYKYKRKVHSHVLVFYVLTLLCFIVGVGALCVDLTTQWTHVNYAAYEYGIHPDPETALPISHTHPGVYPEYFVPKLHGLVFSAALQILVEVTPLIQNMLSFRGFMLLFPHIFTIYLIHGFVFWSLGAMLCVKLSILGIPYWANILVVAIVCYAVIFLSLPLLTPLAETSGKILTRNIWRAAHEEPLERKPTLRPFQKGLILNRS